MKFLKLHRFVKALGTAGGLLLGRLTLPAPGGCRLQFKDGGWKIAPLAVGTNAAFKFTPGSEDGSYSLQLAPLFLGPAIEHN